MPIFKSIAEYNEWKKTRGDSFQKRNIEPNSAPYEVIAPPETTVSGSDKISYQHRFSVDGKPVGKPRQTRRDKWTKRPCVLAYRDYADRIRAAAGQIPKTVDRIQITAFLPMPSSWSTKKKALMDTKPHRTKPDADNICKAVLDALFEEDSGVWAQDIEKYWTSGSGRTNVVLVAYANKV